MNQPDSPRLSRADAELLDRLLAGETLADVVDAEAHGRAEHISRLLSLLDQWEAEHTGPDLAQRTLSGVLGRDPVSLTPADGQALDALLALRRQGLSQGPMPAGTQDRTAKLQDVLALLDRAGDEPVPEGLAASTLQAIEADRQREQQRAALSSMAIASDRQGSIGIRQIATTAALLLMAVSILLPMLNNAQRSAEIAQCSTNLAGLGSDLQQLAFDNKGQTHRPANQEPGVFNPLAKFARSGLDGSAIPANQASYFVLLDERRVASKHLSCPSGDPNDPAALYNGQNPAAGGPFRLFLQARPIFADANPLYRRTAEGLVRDESVPSLTRSVNHDGRGQNVLISDGSVRWMIRPALPSGSQVDDNIWLYEPQGKPDQNDDVFLTP